MFYTDRKILLIKLLNIVVKIMKIKDNFLTLLEQEVNLIFNVQPNIQCALWLNYMWNLCFARIPYFPRRSIRKQSLFCKDFLYNINPYYSMTLEVVLGLFFLIHSFTLINLKFNTKHNWSIFYLINIIFKLDCIKSILITSIYS